MRALALVLLLLVVAPACVSRPERDVVTDVELYGGPEVDSDDALEGMATAETSRFLGIFYRVYEYEIFDENVLSRDLERIERYYRARGHYEARVTAARVLRDDGDVRVEIHVHEGPAVITRSVEISGLELLPIDVSTAALRAMTLQPDQKFDEAQFEETKRVLGDTLANHGYAFVEVKATARVDISQHQAVARYEVKPGPPAHYGEVRIVFVGDHEIPEAPVRANLDIKEGEPYSRQDLREARAALNQLQVLASVDIQEDTSKPESATVPITVYVSEAKLRTIRLGGGARYDSLEFENHLRVGWEDRNFFGGLRRFSVDNRPGLVYWPMRFGSSDLPTRFLVKNNFRSQLKQPSFLEGRTTGFLTGEYNIYPLLYPLTGNIDPEQERIIGYHEVKAQTGVERFFYENHFYLSPSYNWKANFPFTYQKDVPNGLDRVIVSYPELQGNIDFRDDPIRPHKGVFFSNEVQVAGFIFGGDVNDFRIRPEARLYTPLARDKRWTLALRTTFGFLFPSNYGDTLDPATSQGRSLATNPTDPDVIADQHKLLFRAFYSGGPTSNRGYPFRGVGPHGPIGFLVPTGQDCSLDRTVPLPGGGQRPIELKDLPSTCIRPLGGLTLWEASLEVRFPIAGDFSGATFADASDVTRRVGEIRFNFPHLSVGPGFRYDTKVGPLRLDIGIRLPFAQQIGEAEPRPDEGPAEPLSLFGLVDLPIAVHFAFGEAF